MFEELMLYKKTKVKVYMSIHEEPICGTLLRYDNKKGMLILHPHLVIPEKFIIKIEIATQDV